MAKINLNAAYDYTISKPYTLKVADRAIISVNPPTVTADWNEDYYEDIKQGVKRNHLRKQNDKCAYCRNWVEVDGKYEPIEHIVAKSLRPEWMFKVKNLVVTCDTCNGLKGVEPTLAAAFNHWTNFPNKSEAFIIFNPHFDTWSDHFKIEDDIFLVAKRNSKGDDTIRICKLSRYHVPINNARNRLMTKKQTAKAITQRLYITNPTSDEYEQLENTLDYYEQRI